jgi:16S rRNA (guanine1207-N2)-methyltransferase
MQSKIYELLEHSQDLLKDRRLVIAGAVMDERVLKLCLPCKSAAVVTDNLPCARRMAAMIGQEFGDAPRGRVSYKHLAVLFDTIEGALPQIEKSDALLLLLDKSKAQNAKLLALAAQKLEDGALVLCAGENNAGGKSADSLLKALGEPRKADSRRKCTLFAVDLEKRPALPKAPEPVPFECSGVKMTLAQDEAVFSRGRVDPGTQMLLEALGDIPAGRAALDLGCGCGVAGIFMKLKGALSVTSTDVSAAALALAQKNAQLNGAEIKVRAADSLDFDGKFDLIAVNPPFHQGSGFERQTALGIIRKAADHLNAGGELFLVGNTFLGYGSYLSEAFSNVEAVKKDSRFCVYRASNS